MELKEYIFNFSPDKNKELIKERNISFEEVIAAIEGGYLIDIIEHPNPEKYSDQKMYLVEINNYIYLIPFVFEGNETIFLKTIFPSRKATKKHFKEIKENEEK